MKTRPLSMCPELVPAVLDWRKLMTRRPVLAKPGASLPEGVRPEYALNDVSEWREQGGRWFGMSGYRTLVYADCPLGAVGDGLWLRERARILEFSSDFSRVRVRYEATDTESGWLPFPDRLSNPGVGACIANGVHKEGSRWQSRIVEVRIERVQDITEADAVAEGCPGGHGSIPGYDFSATPREHFRHVWSSIYGAASWERNDWVFPVRWEGRQ